MGNGSPILGNSDTFTWHLHADYQVCKYFSPVLEVNGYHVTSNDTGNDGIVTRVQRVDIARPQWEHPQKRGDGGPGGEVRPWDRLALPRSL